MKTSQSLISMFIIFLLLASCGKDNPTSTTQPEPPDPPVNPNTVSKDIGPDGGEITSNDGLLTLAIPQGALGNAETITITPVAADDLGAEFDEIEIGNAYDLGPDGLEFKTPITATFQTDQNPVAGSDSISFVNEFLFTSVNGQVKELDSLRTQVDLDTGTVSVSGGLTHFSPLVQTLYSLETTATGRISLFGFPKEVVASPNAFSAILYFDVIQDPNSTTQPFDITYLTLEQITDNPLEALSPGDGLTELPVDDGIISTKLDYSCQDAGLGLLSLKLEIGDANTSPSQILSGSIFTNINCKEPPKTFNLEVMLSGEGSGVVISDTVSSGTIYCPDACLDEYFEGEEVLVTAYPDEGSVFAMWSGEIGSNAPDNPMIRLTMDQARTVTATFELEQTSGGFLQLGLFTLPILTNPETIVVLGGPEQAFANFPEGSVPALVQGAEGFIVIDLRSGEVLLDFAGLPNNGSAGERTPLGALGVSRPNPGPNTLAVIASYGQDNNNTEFGFNEFPYDIQNQSFIKGPLSPFPSTVDAFPIGGNPISDEVAMVREGGYGINFFRYNDISGEYVFRPSSEILGSNRYGFQQPVTAYGEEVEGAILVVNELSDLYHEPRVGLIPTTLAGNLGQRIIRIRCEKPVCGATDNDASKVPIILWDGENLPSIVGDPIPVGLGPVDLDLYRLSNGNTLIITTGFNDNTIAVIEVDINGNKVNTSIYDLPAGCESPGHAVFADNPDDSDNPFIAGTCYDTDIYFINDSYNTSGWTLNAGVR